MARSYHRKGNNNGVGYCSPPKETQFKSGGKGGPGRPKGSRTLEDALNKLFSKKVAVKGKDGKTEWMFPVEALAMRIFQLGMTTNIRAAETVFDLAQKYGPKEPEPQEYSLKDFSQAELGMYQYLCMKSILKTDPIGKIGPAFQRVIDRCEKIITAEEKELSAEFDAEFGASTFEMK